MSTITNLIANLHDLTPVQGLFLICGFALAVVWKALDIVARSQGKDSLRGPRE